MLPKFLSSLILVQLRWPTYILPHLSILALSKWTYWKQCNDKNCATHVTLRTEYRVNLRRQESRGIPWWCHSEHPRNSPVWLHTSSMKGGSHSTKLVVFMGAIQDLVHGCQIHGNSCIVSNSPQVLGLVDCLVFWSIWFCTANLMLELLSLDTASGSSSHWIYAHMIVYHNTHRYVSWL